MREHDHKSVDLIAATFLSPRLTAVVRHSHTFYGGTPHNPDAPKGDNIPVMARILTIADAFSAMTSHRPYRKAMPVEKAFAELRRCAGAQFDPKIVEVFIEAISARDSIRREGQATCSTEVRLKIGRDIEKLFAAVNHSAISTLATIAHRISQTADGQRMEAVANLASEIESAAVARADLMEIANLAGRLMNACAPTATSYAE